MLSKNSKLNHKSQLGQPFAIICRCNGFLTLLCSLAIILVSIQASQFIIEQKQTEPIECGSIDVRNECDSLKQLQKCTVIKGYLIIVLLPKITSNASETCNYESYRFPLLREITDYLIFFDVKGLTSIRNLLPNLTVIRGRQLFLNYALGITNMPDLERVEFQSLVAIQRGHVFIGSCPKLCYLKQINWERLTMTNGENHIFAVPSDTCPIDYVCPQKCSSSYCWSDSMCQKFEPVQGAKKKCHAECLGGCYNNTNAGCVVCNNLNDHGVCVSSCPTDKLLSEHLQRCYTQNECIVQLGHFIHGRTCVSECPSGFMLDEATFRCIQCAASHEMQCTKSCRPEQTDVITIFNLADADHIKGCQILNGSLVIAIRNQVNELDLVRSLGNLSEIRGHLKIYRSPYLTSLNFLSNLATIWGDPLENDLYGLIIYDNKNLKALWQPNKSFALKRGSMYIHLNNKLCNHLLHEFDEKVMHNKTYDSLQTNDQEVLCGSAQLALDIQVLSHRVIKLHWRKDQTSAEIQLLYRPLQLHEIAAVEQSELDNNVCTRINWQRKLLFKTELQDNGTHYSHAIVGLEPLTKYACLLKTFGSSSVADARSNLTVVTTKMDIPYVPTLAILRKTDNSMTIKLIPNNSSNEFIEYYLLELYEHPDDVQLIDKRNYCNQPALSYEDMTLEAYTTMNHNEDYDDCCARLKEEAEDRLFVAQIRNEFDCNLDRRENCITSSLLLQQKPIQNVRLERNKTTYTLHDLTRFRLYTLQLQACNEIGCSSFSMHSERTNYTTSADKLDDLQACRVPGSTEYRVHFNEPKNPNGLIVSYVIHYRVYMPAVDAYQSHIRCVTRLQHAESKYQHITKLNGSFNEVAVRVHSLAGDIFTPWVNVSSICDHTSAPPVTKLAGIGMGDTTNTSHSLNIFFICFLIGATGTLLWICYKRRYWRKFTEMRRYFPMQRNLRSLIVGPNSDEDRQVLVEEFETVRFHNNPDDELKYLE